MLTLQIKEKEIENLTPEEEFVRGTVGAKCQINFDEFWQSYNKYIVFKRVGYEPINFMVDTLENEIEIPYTILAESGEFKIGVFGTTETETLPTLYSKDIKILYGTDTHGTTPPTYIPSEIDQLRLSKQDKLVSGENIKTVNGESVLGSGNIKIQVEVDQTYTPTSPNAQSGIAVAEALSGYVMAEVGKGLSSNDFTNEDKEKLGSALQADDISDKMDKFGTVELDGTRLGGVTASVKNFQLLNLTGESGLGLGVHEARLHSKEAAILSKLNTETGDSTEVAVGDGIVNLSSGKDDVILNGVATPTDDNHGTNKQYVDEAVAEAVGVANDYTDKAIKSSKTCANNTFAPAIKNTVSGSVLAVHDVSPAEHALNIKLSSDTLTDFSNVGVSRLGKNLYNLYDENVKSQNGVNAFDTIVKENNQLILTEDNSVLVGNMPIMTFYKSELPKGTYILSYNYNFENSLPVAIRPNEFLYYADDTIVALDKLVDVTEGTQTRTITLSKDCTLTINFYHHINSAAEEHSSKTIYKAIFSNIQLEVGTTATDYEPYIEPQTVTANADGTVEGLTSISPDMTIMTDTQGVVIDMTYNADTKMNIDNKIAEISAAIVNKPDEKNLLRVYFANEDTFYVEEGTTITGLFIKFETLRIRGYTNGVWFSKNYAPIDIANEIGAELYTSTSGVTECLKLDDEYGLIFNFTTQQFEYRNRTYIYSKEDNILPIILCEAGRIAYCSPYFVKVMLKNEIAEVKSEIPIVNTIPEYWKSALTSAKNKIKTFQNAGGVNEFTFGFISDIHAGSGTSDTMGQLMKNVLEDCDIPVFLDGGDIVSGTGIISKDGLIAEINREKEILAPIEDKCLRALGNHDVAFGVTDNYDSNLTDNEIYSYIFRSNQSKDGFIYGETGTYFYKDVSAQKTRYIVLDCYQCKTSIDENGLVLSNNKFRNPKLGAKQLQWLANVALNVSEGYTIVICTHHPPYRTSDLSVVGWTGEDTFLDCEVALGIVNAYRNKTTYSYSGSLGAETMEETYDISVDFASAVGDIVCWISGHTHKDYIFNLDGLTVVSTANCSPHVSTNPVGFAPSKTSGTDSEYIMDFVCVNKSTRTANIVRLGAELEDNSAGRSFTY